MSIDQIPPRGSEKIPENMRRDLPPEIWLEIFSYFDYATLSSSIPLVCRYFHRLLKRTSETSRFKLDKILFRDAPGPEEVRNKPKYQDFGLDTGATETEDDTWCLESLTKKLNTKAVIEHYIHPTLQNRFKLRTMGPKLSASNPSDDVVIASLGLHPYPSQTEHENGLGYMFESLIKTHHTAHPPSVHKIWRENATSPPTRNITFKLMGNSYFTWDFNSNLKNHSAQSSIVLYSKSPYQAISVFDVLIAWLVVRYRHCQYWSGRQRRSRVREQSKPAVDWSNRLHPKVLVEEDVKSALWWFLMTNLRLKCSRKGFNTVVWPQVKAMMDEMGSLEKMSRETVLKILE